MPVPPKTTYFAIVTKKNTIAETFETQMRNYNNYNNTIFS